MRYEFIDPFVSSTIRVLDAVVACSVTRGDLALVSGREMDGEVGVLIGVNAHAPGSIIVNMDRTTAVNISNLMTGEGADTLTRLGMDSIAELANMIAGSAISTLNDLGYDFRVMPPQVVSRTEIASTTAGREVFQVPLFTEAGEITVNALLEAH